MQQEAQSAAQMQQEAQNAAQMQQEAQNAAQNENISAEQIAVNERLNEVKSILESRREGMTEEAYQEAQAQIEDYQNKAKGDEESLKLLDNVLSAIRGGAEVSGAFDSLNVDRPLNTTLELRRKGRAHDALTSLRAFQSVYSNAAARDGTILDRFQDVDYTQAAEALRDIANNAANPQSLASQIEQYENLEIDADIAHPENVDTDTLREIHQIKYAAEQRRKDIIREYKMSEKDIRLAKDAARSGSVEYIWSKYNHIVPDDLTSVIRLYEAESNVRRVTKPLRQYNEMRQTQERILAHENCAGLDRAKDRYGITLSLGTPKRNLDLIFENDPAQAEKVYQTYFGTATRHEAERTRHKQELLQKADGWRKLTKPEQQLAGMLADNYSQFAINGDTLTAVNTEQTEQNTLDDITQQTVSKTIEFYKENASQINLQNALQAAEQWREMVGENGIYGEVSAVLARNGYDVPGQLQDYYPHFHERLTKMQDFLRKVGLWKTDTVNFGLNEPDVEGVDYEPTQGDELPTSIAGKTEEFRGRHVYSGNIFTRSTVSTTDYNIVTAFEHYVDPMLDIIHYTDDISKLRALEDQVRIENSTMDVREAFEEIARDTEIDPITKRQKIEQLFSDAQGHGSTISNVQNLKRKVLPSNNLSGYVTWLRRYTDNLAGKKSIDDRSMEYYMGRNSYKTVRSIFGRIFRNMTTSASSMLTNFSPVARAIGEAGPVNVLGAIRDTGRNALHDDGFADMSDFLVIRRGTGPDLSAGKLERATEIVNIADNVVTEIVTRAYYRQALERGKTHLEALEQANQNAANLIGDRSKTQLGLFFQAQNPVFKTFTAFQVEVNNNLQHLVRDIPQKARTEGAASAATAVAASAVCIFLYNEVSEKMTGHRSESLDFIDWIRDFFDIGADEDEKDSLMENIQELSENVMDSLPGVSVLTGGGRIPMSSAIPGSSLGGMFNSIEVLMSSEYTAEEKKQELWNEWTKPFATLATSAFGSQIRKTALGLQTMIQGGMYTTDSNGERVLQAPVDQSNPAQWIQAALFGKSSLASVREYYDEEYSKMSKDETDAYELVKNGEVNVGISADEFYDLQRQYQNIEDDQDEDGKNIDGTREYKMRQIIAEMDLTAHEKSELDKYLIGQEDDGTARTGIYTASADDTDAANWCASMLSNSQLNKAHLAVIEGVSWTDVRRTVEALENVQAVTGENPYKTNVNADLDAYYLSAEQNKMLEIMEFTDLSAKEKQSLARRMVDDGAANYDFTDETTLLTTMVLSDAQQERLSGSELQEITAEDLLQAAIYCGWDKNSYTNVYGSMTSSESEGFQHYSLYGMEQFTAEQKKEIGKILWNDSENIRYDDENTITACMVSTNCGKKWAMASHYGFTIDEYTAAWEAVGGKEKDERISAVMEQTGMSRERAEIFVKIYTARTDKASQYSIDADSGTSVYSGSGSGTSYSSSGSSGKSSRRSSSSSGGSSGSSGSSSRGWSNAAWNGYSASIYSAATMFKNPADFG